MHTHVYMYLHTRTHTQRMEWHIGAELWVIRVSTELAGKHPWLWESVVRAFVTTGKVEQ